MTSLKLRLFLVLALATCTVWLIALAWISIDSRRRFESILDRRLMEAARMVDSLFSKQADASRDGLRSMLREGPVSYERHLSCQIWSLDGRLVGASDGAPDPSLGIPREGFSMRTVGDQRWRIFALADTAKGIRILVADNLGQRQALANGIVTDLMVTAGVALPVIALFIWLSVGRGLRPLKVVANDLAIRDADNLDRVDVDGIPPEIRPLVDALNRLFGKVTTARDHERRFLAYAAHELRTPLAGLKTQVQVAMAATDAGTRNAALTQTMAAVDRSSRLIRQLLTISQLDANQQATDKSWIVIEERLHDLLAGAEKSQAPDRVQFSDTLQGVELRIDEMLFDLVMRNLMENALLMTPMAGRVYWSIARSSDGAGVLSLEDDGPGIAPAERDLVLQRFVRGSRRPTSGSGLGLAIVTAALERSGAALKLESRTGKPGLKVDLTFGPGAFRLAHCDRRTTDAQPHEGCWQSCVATDAP